MSGAKVFKLTAEEANILDKIAEATKMDSWFCIDEDLHVHDIEEGGLLSDAEGVCLLEDGLAYGLGEPQSGGLSPEEIRIAEDCFKRARAAKVVAPKIELSQIALSKGGDDCLYIFGTLDGTEYLLAEISYPDVGNADPEKVKELALEVCEQLDYDVEGVGVDNRI